MKHVAVLGGGPAGAFAAERLAAGGLRTTVFDEKLAWEKPCGGGVTYKAYSRYPFLIDNDTPKKLVSMTRLSAPGAGTADMPLHEPMVIYSRLDLNRMLLERAERAGARIEKARIAEMTPRGKGWRLQTSEGATVEADFCIVATGARNSLRNVGSRLTAADTMQALGYYVPDEQAHIDIHFLSGLEGYIWVFPRCGHLSVGICGRGEPARNLRTRLEDYMRERGVSWKNGTFYSHVLPSLARPAWKNNRIAGNRWIAVGDAGGLVDPVTGEGLYYAMRSGDLASQVVLSSEDSPEQKASAYRSLLNRDFGADLEFAAALGRRFFVSPFLWSSVPNRMIQFMRRSPRFREVVQDLFAGTQPYLDLKRRLMANLHGTLLEVVMNFMLSQRVVGRA